MAERIDKEYTLSLLDHQADLLLGKLEGMRNSGDGTVIHEVNAWICRIDGYKSLSRYRDGHMDAYERTLNQAYDWLVSVSNK